MAADVSVKNPPANPCCTLWKEKCTKLEAGRKHLRQAVQILNEQIDKIQAENVSLKKAYEDERVTAETEKEGKEKELAVRITLENDLSSLKSEINSLKEKGSAYDEDEKGEVKLLQDHVSKAEEEITHLKALLEKEKIRANSEKKSVEAQKKSATEAWKQVKVEKAKADEERKVANIEGKKAEEYRLQLEGLRKQVDEAKLKLVAETLKFEEACKKLEAEKHKVIKERKRADSEMAKAEVQRKLAEANGKKVVEEKSHAENISQLLENAKQRIGELQKEMAEKAKATKEMKNVNTGWKKAEEYQTQLELLRKEADETKAKLTSEILKFEEANKRLEIEKNRVTKERRRADAEMAKAKELRKLAETNAKLAMEEKSRADQLFGLLEESRHKMEELQKQMQELLRTRKTVDTAVPSPGKDVKVETKLKLVEKQVKLERTRLKYAKQVAKLEKNRSSILQEELGRIKLDSIQISERLDSLNKWFSSSVECREGLEKAGVSSKMQRSKLKRKLDDLEALEMYAQNESELLKPSCVAMAASFPLTQTLYCADPWLPVSGGNCTGSISGIDSKLKSLHGGSYRKLLQSSAINSSSGSFSDGQLVGSQEIGALVSKSGKLVEENSDVQTSISGLSGEVTKMHCNENLAVVAEKSARNHLSIDTSGRGNGHGRKWERTLDAIESVEFLYSEGKKLHMQMEEKLCVLHGMLNRDNEKPMAESKYVEASVPNGSHAKREKSHKKKKVPFNERIVLEHEQEKTTQIGNEVHADANACRHTSHPGTKEIPKDCIKVLGDSFRFDCKSMTEVEKIENGDYVKLLDLDDTADEERYRRAMEMPLSPTLPEIEISSAEIFDMNKFKAGDSFHGELLNEKEILMPCSSSDFVDVEISSNSMRCIALGASFNKVQHENKGLLNSFNILGNENGCCDTAEAERAPDRQTRVSEVVEMSNICSSRDDGLKFLNFSSESKLESAHDNIPTYYVVFSDYNDYDSVSRIFCSTRTCVVHCSLDTETECVVQKILSVLKMEEKLLPKEKACTFFTLLLLNFTAFDLRKPGSYMNKNLIQCLDSFAEQINAVVSDVESRSLLASLCCLDELLSLIEDFLINGRVIACTIVPSETLGICDSRMNIFVNGININLSSKPASADQLVAGSIVLASICAAVDHIGFICEASYTLLRIQKYDIDTLLAILHVFAYLGGDKFFSLKEYTLTMKVLKSIIVFLEGGHSPVASAASRFSSSHVVGDKFHPCGKCPFGAVSVDMVVSELLEKLQNQHCPELAILSNFHVLGHESNAKQCCPERVCCALDANSGASCCVMPATHSISVCNGALCYLSDVLSLVELLACHMNWEWTCKKIIPALLDILGRPMPEDFAVAVVVLIGQLGRLGVAACGYEDKEVEDLKYEVSRFLQRDTTMKLSLPVQIAAFTSLLGILPFDLQDVIQGDLKLPDCASQSVFADLIRNWFSSLSKEQQTLSSNLLQSAGSVAS